MPVRIHAEWLTQTDERILETLDETGPLTRPELRATLANISPLLDLSAPELSDRCEKLIAHGLLIRNDDLVAVSTSGYEYLSGDHHLLDRDDELAHVEHRHASGDGAWICPDCGTTGIDGRSTCPVCTDTQREIK